MSRAYTPEEVRQQVIGHIRAMVNYWSGLPGLSVEDRCEGVAFSMLTMIDGSTALPAFNVAVSSHPDDKAFHVERGENFYEDGTVINADVHLHDEFMAVRKGG